jgi:uncharacterized membrane protein HdeD (DUF308 family)
MTSTDMAPRSRGAAIGLGVLMALGGVVLLAWPGKTTLVLVACLGLGVVLYGIHELIEAFTTSESAGSRVWGGIVGVVAVIGGIWVFMTPLMSAIAVGIVIGAYWVAGGIVGIVGTIVVPGNRLVRVLIAVLSLVAGAAVLTQPGLSLVTLVWFSGAWLLAGGIVMAVSAALGRKRTVAPAG